MEGEERREFPVKMTSVIEMNHRLENIEKLDLGTKLQNLAKTIGSFESILEIAMVKIDKYNGLRESYDDMRHSCDDRRKEVDKTQKFILDYINDEIKVRKNRSKTVTAIREWGGYLVGIGGFLIAALTLFLRLQGKL